jgi:hypothetical protein
MIVQVSLDCKTFVANGTGKFLVISIGAMDFFKMDLSLGCGCKTSVTFQAHG